jgi:MoxR-like ATPase
MDLHNAEQAVKRFGDVFRQIEAGIGTFIIGQREVVQDVAVAMLAGGHVLLEGAPGLGKTRLIKALSDVFSLRFGRIQFTPDLMPVDIVGTNVLSSDASGHNELRFQPGPVFVNILLADEINRATPKTQSALLEAMEEFTVTLYGQTYSLPKPFFVAATQNPLEMEGTYPLPEAQLDRFLFKIVIDHPPVAEMRQILDVPTTGAVLTRMPHVSAEQFLDIRTTLEHVPVAASVKDYAIRLYRASNPQFAETPAHVKKYVRYGASPRGARALIAAARAWAMLAGRFHVSSADVRRSVLPVLRHRIVLNFDAEADGIGADTLIEHILGEVQEGPAR